MNEQIIYADNNGRFFKKKSKQKGEFIGTTIEELSSVKKKYDIVYADCPWTYNDALNLQNEGSSVHYNLLTLKQLKNMPIDKISEKNSILFMWVTMPLLEEGLDVIKSWGFTYKTCAFSWVKINPKANSVFKGIGRWVMGNVELCLLATKGRPQRICKNIPQVVLFPRMKHSQKPIEVKERIVELIGDKKRIELFARARKTPEENKEYLGWDVWGLESKNCHKK